MRKYKVVYHIGESIKTKTKVNSGFVFVDDKIISLVTKKKENIAILTSISNLSLFMLNGLGSTIKFSFEGKTIYLVVVRFCIAGQFAMGNFFGTRQLKEILNNISSSV